MAHSRFLLTTAVLFSAAVAPAWGQAPPVWPSRPVRLVVPYPAGPGPADTIARLLSDRLSKKLGQPFVVENRAGASGNISTDYVVKSAPDGYTILITAVGPIAINPSLFKSLPFDVSKDLAPVTLVGTENFVLVGFPGLGVSNLKDLAARMKQNPKSLSFASGGVGSGTHIAGELLQHAMGANILHVPYKGGTQALNDVVGGNAALTFTTAPLAASFSSSGKLVVLAVTSPFRSAALPNVPTMREAGYAGATFTSWYGVFLPVATPKIVAERVHTEVTQAIDDPEVRKKLEEIGLRVRTTAAQELSEFVKAESATMHQIIRAANITAD